MIREKRRFLLTLTGLLTVYAAVAAAYPTLKQLLPGGTSYVSIPLQFVFLLGAVFIARTSHLSWRDFGVTLRNARRATLEAAALTLPLLAAATAAKAWLVAHHPDFAGRALIDLQAVWDHYGPIRIVVFPTIYALFIFAQEFIARGVLQVGLHRLFFPDRTPWLAITLANLVFALTHVHISVPFAGLSFLIGQLWGWMAHRHATLLGASLSHILLGLYIFFVLGPLYAS